MSRVVPWMCREEWLTTYNNLYNFQDLTMQRQGVKMVQAWKSRCQGKLPLSIEATGYLVAAIILDAENAKDSPWDAQLAMAMAIIRFVNGMVDMEQKGVYARSVQSIADDIGLPDWLVDLRHEATHAELPSLEVLRAGSQFSLDWLNEHYWQAQITEIKENNEKLVNLFQNLLDDFDKCVPVGETKKKRNRKQLDKMKEIVQFICHYNDMWDSAITILLDEPALFIPSVAVVKEFAAECPDIFSELSRSRVMNLPKQMLALWGTFFKVCYKENETFLSKLVVALMVKICKLENCSEDEVVVRYLACWVRFILLNSSGTKADAKTWDIKPELDYPFILEACLMNVSAYMPVFLALITNGFPNLPAQLHHKLEKLSSLITDSSQRNIMQRGGYVLKRDVVHDNLARCYPRLADHAEARLQTSPFGKNNSGWKSCDPLFIASFPLGGLIGCEPMQFETLELPKEHIPSTNVHTQLRKDEFPCSSQITASSAPSDDNGQTLEELMDDSLSDMEEEESCDTGNVTPLQTLGTSPFKSIAQEIFVF